MGIDLVKHFLLFELLDCSEYCSSQIKICEIGDDFNVEFEEKNEKA